MDNPVYPKRCFSRGVSFALGIGVSKNSFRPFTLSKRLKKTTVEVGKGKIF